MLRDPLSPLLREIAPCPIQKKGEKDLSKTKDGPSLSEKGGPRAESGGWAAWRERKGGGAVLPEGEEINLPSEKT